MGRLWSLCETEPLASLCFLCVEATASSIFCSQGPQWTLASGNCKSEYTRFPFSCLTRATSNRNLCGGFFSTFRRFPRSHWRPAQCAPHCRDVTCYASFNSRIRCFLRFRKLFFFDVYLENSLWLVLLSHNRAVAYESCGSGGDFPLCNCFSLSQSASTSLPEPCSPTVHFFY